MIQSLEEQVREVAYHLWRSSGMIHGSAHEHWLQAERAVTSDLMGATAAKPKAVKSKSAKPTAAKSVAAKTVAVAAKPKAVAAKKPPKGAGVHAGLTAPAATASVSNTLN